MSRRGYCRECWTENGPFVELKRNSQHDDPQLLCHPCFAKWLAGELRETVAALEARVKALEDRLPPPEGRGVS